MISRENENTINGIENYVFAGAGVDGITYVGAVLESEKRIGPLSDIKRVAGASSGSIMAMLVALNLDASRIAELFNKIDFSKIPSKNIITKIDSLFHEDSLNSNKVLRKILEDLMIEAIGSADLTFGQLAENNFKDLHVVATCAWQIDGVKTVSSIIFSADNASDTKIIDVILASSAIPAYFPAVYLKEVSPGKWVEATDGFAFYDGGLLLDFPERVFDKPEYFGIQSEAGYVFNPKTLGFIPYPNEVVDNLNKHIIDIRPLPKKNVIDLIEAIGNGELDRKETALFEHKKDPRRIVLLKNNGIVATDFKITQVQKDQLKDNGVEGMKDYHHRQKVAAGSHYSSGQRGGFFFKAIRSVASSSHSSVSLSGQDVRSMSPSPSS
jgi:predicted acylesterase/phospholipase RssA